MLRNRFSKTLALFLPGIFLLGFNIGTGSVTSMAKAGATYGMSLLWTIVASCLATFLLIMVYGRYTLVTGETALQAFRKHIHPAVGIFFIVALTAGVSGSVMGVMGIVADISFEWSKTMVDGGIAPIYFAMFYIALVYYIFWNGRTQFFERSLAVIVAIMSACFILNFFIMMPPPIDILMVKEAGWTVNDMAKQRNDAIVSVAMMFVISGSIMAAAAGTLYAEGLGLTKASQMIELLEPLVGAFAMSIFAIGIIAAGVSSQFPNVLMLPWLLCDYNQSKREMTLPRYRIMVFFISLLGLVVPIFEARPVFVMIVSQAFQSIILPVTVLCILYLGNRRDLMGKHKHTTGTNIFLVAILLFSIVTTSMGIRGVWQLISS
jgi:Mn2+/Fe2+ NRAMP family transporter